MLPSELSANAAITASESEINSSLTEVAIMSSRIGTTPELRTVLLFLGYSKSPKMATTAFFFPAGCSFLNELD